MNKTIFLNDITLMDFCVPNEDGEFVGMSARLHAEVTGPVEEHEQVVIDFSKCKKLIKHIIDNTPAGIDHKLVVMPFSNATVERTDDTVQVTTPKGYVTSTLYIPGDACVVEVENRTLDQYLSKMLSREVSAEMGVDITINAVCDYEPVLPQGSVVYSEFSYTHGLKTSSSHGCKFISHGHLSYVATDDRKAEAIIEAIAEEFDKAIMMNKNDMYDINLLNYENERGLFTMKCVDSNIIVMNTDSTIENMIDYVTDKYGDALREAGATKLWVSEGLVKGACVKL